MRGDGRIYKRGEVFWVCYYLRGKQFREPAKNKDGKNVADPTEAQKFLKARLREVGADLIGARTFTTPRASRLSVGELLEALKADFELRGKLSTQNASHLRRAVADFGGYLAVGLTPEKIDAYKKERLAASDKPASINRPLQVVRQSYRLAMKRGHLSRAPFIEMLSEKGNERRGFLSEQEFRDVLAHLPTDLQDLARYCYATGTRKGEAAGLTWRMVAEDELRIPGDICKNRKPRVLPISGELAGIIERRRSARRIEENGNIRMASFVFHRDGEDGPIREFRKSWARAAVAAKLGAMICPKCKAESSALTCPECKTPTKYRGRTWHDFRRSAVRNMVKAGVSTQVAKVWSGHSSDSVFERYSILTTDDLRDAQRQTEQYREGAQQAAEQKIVAMR